MKRSSVSHRDDHAEVGRPDLRRAGPMGGLVQLQQQAGNAAVTAAVQRQLEVDGQPDDVAKVLKMLETASGLTLKRDRKKRVTVDRGCWQVPFGGADQAPPDDPVRPQPCRPGLARTERPRRRGSESSPTRPKGAQELRVDHILDLEKAVPGAGVASLAHEIVENYEGQAIPASDWDTAHATVHPAAVAASDAVLEQLQQSAGQAPSGARLNTYLAEVKQDGGEKTLRIGAHRNEFFVFDVDLTGIEQAPGHPAGAGGVNGRSFTSAVSRRSRPPSRRQPGPTCRRSPTCWSPTRRRRSSSAPPLTRRRRRAPSAGTTCCGRRSPT